MVITYANLGIVLRLLGLAMNIKWHEKKEMPIGCTLLPTMWSSWQLPVGRDTAERNWNACGVS